MAKDCKAQSSMNNHHDVRSLVTCLCHSVAYILPRLIAHVLAVLKVKEVIIIPTQTFLQTFSLYNIVSVLPSRFTITPRPIIVYCFTITPRPQSIHFPGAFKIRKMIPN